MDQKLAGGWGGGKKAVDTAAVKDKSGGRYSGGQAVGAFLLLLTAA
jgi:hypothetical protein